MIRNESGLSLIATLWIVTILSVIATEFLYSISLETKMGRNQLDRVKLSYAAKSGFEMAVAALKNDTTSYDALTEEWANGINDQLQDGVLPDKSILFQVKIVDELSKIDLNQAEPQLLSRTLELAGAEAQTASNLAQAIVQRRSETRFRTVGELANIEGMTTDLLYGNSSTFSDVNSPTQTSDTSNTSNNGKNAIPLISLLTVYSIDKNVSADGQKRLNLNEANAQQLSQTLAGVLSQGEARAIIDQRSQAQYSNIGGLFDTAAISQNTFNQIRDRITTRDEPAPPGGQPKVNINTANLQQLQTLPGIDQGLAEDIIRHRQANGNFSNIEAIRNVKLINLDDMKQIADKISITNDDILRGKININTASLEVLSLLPGMDEAKAKAIIERRESQNPNQAGQSGQSGQASKSNTSNSQETGNPFTSVGQLLDIPGFDQNVFRQVSDQFTYRSQAFSIEALGLSDDGMPIGYCLGVIDRSGNGIQTRYWKQR
jgi:competence ComEA-like helix-hairpin-helix protein